MKTPSSHDKVVSGCDQPVSSQRDFVATINSCFTLPANSEQELENYVATIGPIARVVKLRIPDTLKYFIFSKIFNRILRF